MKKSKILVKLIIVVLFSVNYINSFAQDYEFEDFWTFKNQKLIYYDSIRVANNGEMKGTGYTQFMRWLDYWQEAVYNDGGFDSTLKAKQEKYISIINTPEEYASVNVEWNELGPLHCPGNKYCINWNHYYDIKGTGRCYFIEFDSQDSSKMFTGSPTGGLFYSIDGGESWENGGTDFLPNPGIASMKVNPFNSNAWYIATGEGHGYDNFSFSYGLFRTMNGGLTWESISNGLDIPDPTTSWWKNHCRKIIFDPSNGNRLFAVFNTGIYKTENALADADLVEWDLVQSGYFKDIHFKPGNNSIMYASGESIFWSEDSGNTWTLIPNIQQVIIPDDALVILRVTPDNSDVLYAAVIINSGNPDTEKLYKWDYNTQTWNSGYKMTGDGGMNIGRLALAVSPYNENIVLRSQMDHVYKSINAGQDWSAISDDKHDDSHWICYGENENIVWIGTDGGINKSIDGCNTWTNKTNNIGVANMHNIGSGKKRTSLILYGGYDTGTSFFEEDENEWYQLPKFGDSWECAIDDSDINGPPIIYFTTHYGFYRSLDGGYIYSTISIPSNIVGQGWGQTFVKDYYNQNILYLPGMKRIGRSINHGDNWDQISPNAQEENINRMWIKIWNSIDHPNYMYAHRINSHWDDPDPDAFRLFKSINCNAISPSSVTWSDVTPQFNNQPYPGWISDIAIDERNPDKIWVCYNGYLDGNPKVLYFNGSEWIDFTGDENGTLNGYSVLTVKYQIGTTNDLIYIGTNAGVFYRSDLNTEWTKMEGLPHSQVKELEISYCANKLRSATFGRGLWETDLIGDKIDVYQSFNDEWNTHKLLLKNLIIPEGITLTIKGVVELSQTSKIIVERGAKLILDGGTLTNACEGMWKGVEVWGSATQTQSELYQGVVEVINGGTIENAICGIQTIKMSIPEGGEETPDYNFTGGIVTCDEGIFKNNKTAVKFWPYNQSPSVSYFRECDFITNDDLIAGTDVEYFIDMSGISGIHILGNSFNDEHFFEEPDELTTGIYAFNSQFYVLPQASQPNIFSRLYYGIKALATNPLTTLEIKNNQFTNNLRSVYLSATNNATVNLNVFNPWIELTVGSTESYCMYLDHCSGYTVEENSFTNGLEYPKGIGLVVNQSGYVNNMIYKNYFNNLLYATLAQNENRSKNGLLGLQFKCNEFIENASDLSVTYIPPKTKSTGIAANQGANSPQPDAPAGNLFSWTGPTGSPTDINNEGNPFTYYYHVNPYLHLEPIYITPLTVAKHPVPLAQYNEQSCPSHLEGGGGGGGQRESISLAKQQTDSIQQIISSLEDGGNTIELAQAVEWSIPPESMEVYNELMNNSPFLTDTVIGAAIEKEDVLANAMIRDVMVANPQSSKDDELLDKLEVRNNPVPDYMMGEILQGRSLVSVYEELQSKLSFYTQKRNTAYQSLVTLFLTDTINPGASNDSLAVLFSNEQTPEAKYNLAFLSMKNGEWNSGLEILNQASSQFDLTEEQQAEQQYLVELCTLFAGLNGILPDSVQMNELYVIESANAGIGSVYARNILLALHETEYNEPVILPEALKSSEVVKYEQYLQSAADMNYLEVFPNPSQDHVIISWKMDNTSSDMKIKITDNTCKNILEIAVNSYENQKVFDTRKLKPGVYIATLFENGKQKDSAKFTLIK